ncbi:MAG: pyridoxamine 5'-phosphate oxidase family protein [Clostridia bacterium]|nr:pyridoxamine 5'-phosphate oxidase family protein [Clostridia bacterium]
MTLAELQNLIDRSLFATLAYRDGEDRIQIRRVFCTWHRGLGRHLISTNTSSGHVACLLRDGRASLYFADDVRFEGLNLTGTVTVHTERPWKELLWHDGDEKYYPKGVDDPDYCVLEFAADGGAYYRFDGKGTLTREETEAWDRDRSFADTYALTHAAGEP